MSRLETVRENWTDITDKLLRDKQLLAHFLRFSVGMYKQSFSGAALIYQQNPYATKVATLETWNKLGRLVNRSDRSIAVFGEDNKAKHLFDISQTNRKRILMGVLARKVWATVRDAGSPWSKTARDFPVRRVVKSADFSSGGRTSVSAENIPPPRSRSCWQAEE